MALKNVVQTITGVVALTDIMDFLGVTEDSDREDFTTDISGVTWGDASFTLVNLHTFWLHFIKNGTVVRMPFAMFEKQMLDNSVNFIDLEN